MFVLLAACTPLEDWPEHRQFQTEVECVRAGTEDVDWDEAVDRFDRDGDLRLTESDLRAGEAAAVARVSGVYVDDSQETPERAGFATHADWNATIRADDEETLALEMRLNCFPTVVTTASFRLPAEWTGERSPAEFLGFDFHGVDAHVRNEAGTETIEGTLHVAASEGGLSGAFEGVVEAPLATWDIPDGLNYEVSPVTGQVGEIHGFAFRDLEVAP